MGSQTDSTRARNLELIIQQRVTSELEKHLKSSSERLSSLSESISKEPAPQSGDSPSSRDEKPLSKRISEKLRGDEESEEAASRKKAGIDRNAVAKEIDALKKKLDARPKKVELDREVERAKEQVIICLRKNDRRPLDCWQEVEKFKHEVGRLEKKFIDQNAG